jgi:hypothetical protein
MSVTCLQTKLHMHSSKGSLAVIIGLKTNVSFSCPLPCSVFFVKNVVAVRMADVRKIYGFK